MPTQAIPDRSTPPRLTSYEEERASYSPELPDAYNPVVDIVERWAQEAPDDIALISLDGELPKTVSGKIRRSELRERLGAG